MHDSVSLKACECKCLSLVSSALRVLAPSRALVCGPMRNEPYNRDTLHQQGVMPENSSFRVPKKFGQVVHTFQVYLLPAKRQAPPISAPICSHAPIDPVPWWMGTPQTGCRTTPRQVRKNHAATPRPVQQGEPSAQLLWGRERYHLQRCPEVPLQDSTERKAYRWVSRAPTRPVGRVTPRLEGVGDVSLPVVGGCGVGVKKYTGIL